MINKIFINIILLIFFFNNVSFGIELQGNFAQGGLIKGKIEPGAKVFLDKKQIKVSSNGYFVFGIEKNRKQNILLEVHNNGEKKVLDKKVKKRNYLVQKIEGLPTKMVTPGKEEMIRIQNEQVLFDNMRSVNSDSDYFYKKFIRPAEGIISGRFGSQRILNGEPRNPHLGLDIANKKGTPVISTADGVVTIAEKDLYFTGGTIAIEHGHGVTSLYYHLDSLSVKIGQKVTQGQLIGTIGSTGRSTAPHIHFGIYWTKVPVDPELVLTD
jgi:murein DD-endopeptidase MepM/ murein hydrolase activator NlpD